MKIFFYGSLVLACGLLTLPARAQSVFYDTFSGFLRGDVFQDLSGWRTSTGSYNGGQLGRTNIVYNEVLDGANITATASTISQGFFTARNYAFMNIANAEEARYTVQSSHGSRTTVQFFTPLAVTPVRTRFHWSVTGSTSSASSNPTLVAGATLRFAAGNYNSLGYYDFFDLQTQQNGGSLLYQEGVGNAVYDLPITVNQTIDLFYHSVAFAGINALAGESFSASADFRNTHILERVDLFDANDNLIPNWGMRDMESGQVVFDQNGRTAAANAAPEPSTLALLAVSSIALLGFARRKRQ
jgi:hypothetical protein